MKRKVLALVVSGVLTASLFSGSVMAASAVSDAESAESVAESTESLAETQDSAAEAVEEVKELVSEEEAESAAEAAEEAQDSADEDAGLLAILGGLFNEETMESLKGVAGEAAQAIGGVVEELQDPESELSKGLSSVVDEVKQGIEGVMSGEEDLSDFLGIFGSIDMEDAEKLLGSVIGGLTGSTDSEMEEVLRDALDSDEVFDDPLDDAITRCTHMLILQAG